MNKTYIRDIEKYDCDICGSTVELHAASLMCSNFDCPTNDPESDKSWTDVKPD